MAAFLGMRGNGDWSDSDMRPKNWREMVLYLYPNGDAPLTALLSMMPSQRTDDPEFNWWTQTWPDQAGAVTDVYTDAAMATSYVSGGTAGDVLYVKVAAATIAHIRVGHQVMLSDASDYTVDVNAKVIARTANGANSCVAVKLLEDDDNSTAGDLSDCDRIKVIGNINPEFGTMPDAIAYDPTKFSNYTQIFRTPLSISRTARRTKLRTGDQYQKAKREALEYHSAEMEMAFIFGIATEGTGDNSKPERTTGGILPWIKSYGVTSDYVTDETYDNTTWANGGEAWLDEHLEEIFRYGGDERLALVGSNTVLGINKLVKAAGNYDLKPMTTSYGIKVMQWVTPFGVVNMKRHPLMSYDATYRSSMILFEPKNLLYRYIDDTTFYKEGEKQNTGAGRLDGTSEEFLTEAGLEFHHPATCGYLNGFNQDNPA